MDNTLVNVCSAVMESITHYYKLLSQTGYVKQSVVNKLLVLSFIDDIIHDFPPIDEKDYNALCKVWDCLAFNTCLIPWNMYRKYSGKTVSNISSRLLRVTDTDIRFTSNQVRTTQL